jgi:peptide/nickel transport system ATP-binding protein
MPSPLLEINNLKVSFARGKSIVDAVKGISFSIDKGETIGIVGESGSGKSVTALSIMQILSHEAICTGEIILRKENDSAINLMKLSTIEKSNYRGNDISMIFQEPMTSLNPVISCGKQVAEMYIRHKKNNFNEARQKTIELFESVNLPRPQQVFNAYPHQLSGGQKQRVMIAMAMSCDPKILIADEPTTALDLTVQSNILKLMKNLQERKSTSLLFITHDLSVVAQIAKRVLVIFKGQIVEQGTVTEIFNNPQHPYTRGLLECRPPLNKRPRILPTIHDFMIENNDGVITAITNSVVDNEIGNAERRSWHQQLYSREPVLQVKNMSVSFPVKKGVFGITSSVVQAVDDVSFDVYPGESLGLVGESGCGKTTLALAILRLIEAEKGKVVFLGKDLFSIEENELRKMRKHIQIIFQDPYSSLNPLMTVGQSILEPMQVYGLHPGNRKQKVYELLERVNLKQEHYDRYPHEFSAGQRQRICIARALALQPDFLICDECVSSLDVSVQAQILNLLNQLKRDLGFSCIFISHDLSVVKFMCDRMMVMHQGKIDEIGDPDIIYSNPLSPNTRNLIDAIPSGIPEINR